MPENRGWAISSAPTAILPPNSGTVYGLPEAQGYDSLQTGQFKSFLQDLDMGADPSPKANGNMDFAWGVPSKQSRFAALRYLVFPEEVPGLWRPAYTGVDGVVYIDSQALPRVNAVSGANPAFFDTAPTRIAIHAVDRSDITVADQWYPGWIARENGRTLPVLKGPFVFRTVPGVRPGILTLQYAPVSFRFGLYALCITLAALTAFVTTALTTRWRSAPECPSPSR